MVVAPPKFKPPTPNQRGLQPDRTLPTQNQWFTKPSAVALCMDILTSQLHRTGKTFADYIIVEPSVGDGKFYDHLPPSQRVGVDIAPQISGIQKSDFLTWQPPKSGKYMVIGNPPFGVRGNLADAFIRRAALFADVCAFILPISYINPHRSYFTGFDLIHSEKLPPDIFINIDGRESKPAGQGAINTVFNVWIAGDSPPPPKINYVCQDHIRVAACNYPTEPRHFIKNSDIFIKARFYGKPTVSQNFDHVRSRNSHYVVGISAAKNKRTVIKAVKHIDWLTYATQAMNGSYTITLTNTRKALSDIGFAKEEVTHHSQRALL